MTIYANHTYMCTDGRKRHVLGFKEDTVYSVAIRTEVFVIFYLEDPTIHQSILLRHFESYAIADVTPLPELDMWDFIRI